MLPIELGQIISKDTHLRSKTSDIEMMKILYQAQSKQFPYNRCKHIKKM